MSRPSVRMGMYRLPIRKPVSAGLILSYKCSSICRHCMYACSPRWSADWIPRRDLEHALSRLAPSVRSSPYGPDRVSLNYGLHFTGGEPFLNFSLLVEAVRIARDLKIPSLFVETNCFWCVDEENTREKLKTLKEVGLNGILISVNPFILEQIPFERIERAIRVSGEVFRGNTMIYQEIYYHQFKTLGVKGVLPLSHYLQKGSSALRYAELLPMGRACYALGSLFRKHPASHFFGESCLPELTRNWHVHVDNYLNYMTGYCGGISLGKVTEDIFSNGVDLEDRPILHALVTDIMELYTLALEKFNYRERKDGYVSKCHLCIDIRRHIARQTDAFKELQPRELYEHLE
ncbi:MAG: hypothetical protein ACUVQ0_01370 [Thermoproteota archaeon]